jgi:hypothetical protein
VTYGGDSGNRIFVLYWRCSLISVSVIRGSTVIGGTMTLILEPLEELGLQTNTEKNIVRSLPEERTLEQ